MFSSNFSLFFFAAWSCISCNFVRLVCVASVSQTALCWSEEIWAQVKNETARLPMTGCLLITTSCFSKQPNESLLPSLSLTSNIYCWRCLLAAAGVVAGGGLREHTVLQCASTRAAQPSPEGLRRVAALLNWELNVTLSTCKLQCSGRRGLPLGSRSANIWCTCLCVRVCTCPCQQCHILWEPSWNPFYLRLSILWYAAI